MHSDHFLIMAALIIVVSFMILVGFIVWRLSRDPSSGKKIAAVLIAVGTLFGALPPIIYAFYAWAGS